MKAIEIVKLSENILKSLQEACIRIDDVRYIALFDEYTTLVSRGAKVSAAVYILAGKYGISERSVYYILRRFTRDCKIGATPAPT